MEGGFAALYFFRGKLAWPDHRRRHIDMQWRPDEER
jgi:hypothetical protein